MTTWLDPLHEADDGERLVLGPDDQGIVIRWTSAKREDGMIEFALTGLNAGLAAELLGSVIGTVLEGSPIEVRFAFVDMMIGVLVPEIQPDEDEAAS